MSGFKLLPVSLAPVTDANQRFANSHQSDSVTLSRIKFSGDEITKKEGYKPIIRER